MYLPPVIERELRVTSRRAGTWWLRVIFAGSAVLAFVFGLLWPDTNLDELGQVTLVCLAVCGFGLSLLAGAYLTADAISAEKRQGTLGLLLLTPLKAWEIVLGKMATHALQVGSALIGGFQVFFLPLLLGGVLGAEVLRILLVLSLTLALSLACGMFWSARVTEARAAVLGALVSLLLATFLPLLGPFIQSLGARGSVGWTGLPQLSPMTALIFAFDVHYRTGVAASLAQPSGASVYWGGAAAILASTVLLLGLSGWRMARFWRRAEEGGADPSRTAARAVNLRARIDRPRGWLTLDRAPLTWLCGRGLGEGRAMVWVRRGAFCALMLMVWIAVTTGHWEEGFTAAFCIAFALHLITRIQLALQWVKRTVEDRTSGALELLLVAPVAEADYFAAYHAALRQAAHRPLRSLLAMNALLELSTILFYDRLHMDGGAFAVFTVFFVGGALITLADLPTLRWLALRYALSQPTQLRAAGCALGLLVGVPWPTFGAALLIAMRFGDAGAGAALFAGWAGLCLLYDRFLIRRCRDWFAPGLRHRVAEPRAAAAAVGSSQVTR